MASTTDGPITQQLTILIKCNLCNFVAFVLIYCVSCCIALIWYYVSECNGICKQVTDTVCICQLVLWIYLDIAKGIDLDTLFECTIGTSFKVYTCKI